MSVCFIFTFSILYLFTFLYNERSCKMLRVEPKNYVFLREAPSTLPLDPLPASPLQGEEYIVVFL